MILLSLRPRALSIFLVSFSIALGFALYTEHAWEDYYITYRCSKNLATGQGLVFTPGDRLHSFTSPLGVLLPALASVLVWNSSDEAALWLFRLASIAALAGAATLLLRTMRSLHAGGFTAVLLALLVLTDAKSVDFSINGMETGFLLLFLAYALWASLTDVARAPLHLGLAWAGLMWTRPDSFIYIGLLVAAVWLFRSAGCTPRPRLAGLKVVATAGSICALLYLPWFIFAWLYYGSPVPHTILAKSAVAGTKSLAGFAQTLAHLPSIAAMPGGAMEAVFAPTYAQFGGWPPSLGLISRLVAAVCSLAWLVPGLRRETRVASFCFLGAALYLMYFPPFPYPWYLCAPSLLGYVVVAGLIGQLRDVSVHLKSGTAGRMLRVSSLLLAIALVGGNGWLLVQSARQMKQQQALIENANRRSIGEWLRAQAAAQDSVFLEPLGYIGFFSQLKTYDYPGLSSRAMVDCVRRHGTSWGACIKELEPGWLVLRPREIRWIDHTHPGLIAATYRRVAECDARAHIAKLNIYGREYLEFDAVFTVFQRRSD